MKSYTPLVAIAILSSAMPAVASAQALPSLASVRTAYATRKATVMPTGALKVRIDSVDAAITEATRLGRTGEIRRLILKGTTLLAGQPWTDTTDYARSLVLRTEAVVLDAAKPFVVRLEQIYPPSIQLAPGLVAKVSLRRVAAAVAAPAGRGAPIGRGAAQIAADVKDLGIHDGVSRDLSESPRRLDVDLRGVPDGRYELVVDVMSPTVSLGTVRLPLHVINGLDAMVTDLEAAAGKAPEVTRAEIRYPIDRMRMVNRGTLELRTFDPERDFAAARSVATAANAGKDPFAGRTGDFKRHYLLESANEIMPFRMYVPSGYSSGRAYPLIIALHGLGGTEDSFFAGYEGNFQRLAEARGYILAAPLGYRVDGGYGWGVGNPPADPIARRNSERSEEDVMQVLALVCKQYNVDPKRVYLMGHSMGAIGTWKIAPKFPELWAAIGAFAGSGAPATLERIQQIPNFVVHGDADATVNVRGSRTMVARMKELGMTVTYIEVPGGTHGGVVAPNAAAMYDFFDAHRKK
jgi:poly(3-hydroxybutyrate) depolymerase